jgi:hypothetical protein
MTEKLWAPKPKDRVREFIHYAALALMVASLLVASAR